LSAGGSDLTLWKRRGGGVNTGRKTKRGEETSPAKKLLFLFSEKGEKEKRASQRVRAKRGKK